MRCGIVGELLGVVDDQRPHLAEGAVGDDLPDADHVRKVPRPHRLEEEEAAIGSEVGDHPGLAGVQRERLLDEHVLARLEHEPGIRGVQRMRRRHVHDVDLGIRGEGLVARVRVRDVELRGERVGRRLRPRPTACTVKPLSFRSFVNAWAMPPVARMPQRSRSVMGESLVA